MTPNCPGPVGMLESREYEGSAARRVAAFPMSENPVRWKGLAETDGDYRLFQMNVLTPFDPASGEIAPKAEAVPAIEAANQTRPFQVMREFAIYPLYRVTPDISSEGANRVELSDLRFPFVSTAVVDRNNRVLEAALHFLPQ